MNRRDDCMLCMRLSVCVMVDVGGNRDGRGSLRSNVYMNHNKAYNPVGRYISISTLCFPCYLMPTLTCGASSRLFF